MALIRCTLHIFLQGFRSLLFSKKALLFFAGGLLYAAVCGIAIFNVADRVGPNELYANITWVMLWQALMPLTAVYFSVAAIRDEIAGRTIVHLLSGPVPRSSVWLGKFLAASAAVIVLVGASYAIGASVAKAIADTVVDQSSDWRARPIETSTLLAPVLPIVFGVPAYCAVGSLLAVWFKRPMIAGAVYVIGWEQFVGSTPTQAGARSMTVVDSVRALFANSVEAAPRFQRDQRAFNVWDDHSARSDLLPPSSDAIMTLLWLTAVALLLALWFGQIKDYDSQPKD